jgi:uncharacterized membrane protein
MLATVLIFGAGVFTGGMLVDYVKQPHGRSSAAKAKAIAGNEAHASSNAPVVVPARLVDNAKVRPAEILSKQFLQQVDQNLHLSNEQREAIQKIIGDGQNEIRKVIQDARLEIREVLTPNQQKQFDEIVKRPFRRPIYGPNGAIPVSSLTNAPLATNAP